MWTLKRGTPRAQNLGVEQVLALALPDHNEATVEVEVEVPLAEEGTEGSGGSFFSRMTPHTIYCPPRL